MKEHFWWMHLLDWMSKLEAAKKKKAIGQPDKEPTPKFFPKVLTLSGNFHGTLGTDKARQQPLHCLFNKYAWRYLAEGDEQTDWRKS